MLSQRGGGGEGAPEAKRIVTELSLTCCEIKARWIRAGLIEKKSSTADGNSVQRMRGMLVVKLETRREEEEVRG